MTIEPPTWVRKRDGRVVPFDTEHISETVFAAAESINCPDVFLARELTTGITHFLSEEAEGRTVSVEQIAETVVKIVRELGHPQLAQALESTVHHTRIRVDDLPSFNDETTISIPRLSSAGEVRQASLRAWSLDRIYSREIARAANDGLLTIGGLEHPDRLAGGLIEPPTEPGTFFRLLTGSARARGQVLVISSGERCVKTLYPEMNPNSRSELEQVCAQWTRDLRAAAELAGCEIHINLNCRRAQGTESTLGPLFPSEESPAQTDHELLSEVMLEQVSQHCKADPRISIDWHLEKHDLTKSQRPRLAHIARLATSGIRARFVFDRHRKPIQWAEGILSRHPLILQNVGLNLSQLSLDDSFEKKLPSLTRMGLSVGIQKRAYLRRLSTKHPELSQGFLLERARLLVTPLGLSDAVHRLTGRAMGSHPESCELGCNILTTMQGILKEEGRRSGLECCVDSPLGLELSTSSDRSGITGWDWPLPPSAQIETISKLQSITASGTGILLIDEAPSPEQLIDWLHQAWQQPVIVRLRIERVEPRQLIFPVT